MQWTTKSQRKRFWALNKALRIILIKLFKPINNKNSHLHSFFASNKHFKMIWRVNIEKYLSDIPFMAFLALPLPGSKLRMWEYNLKASCFRSVATSASHFRNIALRFRGSSSRQASQSARASANMFCFKSWRKRTICISIRSIQIYRKSLPVWPEWAIAQ